ncbi:MFS general substrate transporter [Gonapodya prolifera JEL478]|uniref:MFS general substrate transporter n=1 Tax=Gonapodya prolifera (strain JEL478) TaxID=1344416 RepID=A0A139ANR0_GONPJ|nr:MFS general substrate transporter [Gonapodya prolifera JEL478]|eukprot:KXS18380.1 MFS general substrate transporter [Gonapodya prolifera JEL478]
MTRGKDASPLKALLGHHLYLEILCCGLVFLSGFIYSATIPILAPLVLGKLHRSQEELGLLFAFYAFGSLIFTPIVGYGTDRFFPYNVYTRKRLEGLSRSHYQRTAIDFNPRRGILLFSLVLCLAASVIYSLAGSYEWLCFVRLLQALMDSFTWIVTLAVWSRFCSERQKQAAWVDGQWEAYGKKITLEGKTVRASRPEVVIPESSFGSTIIVSSHWIGELCSLPIAGYLFDKGLWVFGPAVLITVVLMLGWLVLDLSPSTAVDEMEMLWAELGDSEVETGYGATNHSGAAIIAPSAETDSADSVDVVEEEQETKPLLGASNSPSPQSAPSVLSFQVGLVLVPLFLTIFLAAGLEPTLPVYLQSYFNASPTEVGGVYFLAWTLCYICGMMFSGKVLELPIEWEKKRKDVITVSESEAQKATTKSLSDTWGLWVLVVGIVVNAIVSPLLVVPAAISTGVTAKVLEVVILGIYGFTLGFTLAPTLPEMNRVANKQLGLDSAPTASGGHSPVASDNSTGVDVGATLYGIWCFVYSGAMLISQPLSSAVYAKFGFLSQLGLYSVLMFSLGVLSMVALLRDQARSK